MSDDSSGKRVTDIKPKTIKANKAAVQLDYVDRDGKEKRKLFTAAEAAENARLMRMASQYAAKNRHVYRRYAEDLEAAAHRAKMEEVNYAPKRQFAVGVSFDKDGRIIRDTD